MKKSEIVLREIIEGTRKGTQSFHQRQLSQELGVSIGLVNKVVAGLEERGAVLRRAKSFEVIDIERMILHWAAVRKFKAEISEEYCLPLSVTDIEKNVPGFALFTAYTAWKFRSGSVPFDYGGVYIYVREKDKDAFREWVKEQKPGKGKGNLLISFTKDDNLFRLSEGNLVPFSQMFADLYSLGTLESKYFIKEIMKKEKVFRFE